MECKIIKSVCLTMSESEAIWLKNIMQNPMGDQDFIENDFDADIREKIFNTLKNVID